MGGRVCYDNVVFWLADWTGGWIQHYSPQINGKQRGWKWEYAPTFAALAGISTLNASTPTWGNLSVNDLAIRYVSPFLYGGLPSTHHSGTDRGFFFFFPTNQLLGRLQSQQFFDALRIRTPSRRLGGERESRRGLGSEYIDGRRCESDHLPSFVLGSSSTRSQGPYRSYLEFEPVSIQSTGLIGNIVILGKVSDPGAPTLSKHIQKGDDRLTSPLNSLTGPL